MTPEDALVLFTTKATALVELLERGLASGKNRLLFEGNGEIALRNARSWLAAAHARTLQSSYGKTGFGIGKSDLMFGEAEQPMYDLERLYLEHLS